MTARSKISLALLALVTALVLVPLAAAHAEMSPEEAPAGEETRFTLSLANELPDSAFTKVVVQFPESVVDGDLRPGAGVDAHRDDDACSTRRSPVPTARRSRNGSTRSRGGRLDRPGRGGRVPVQLRRPRTARRDDLLPDASDRTTTARRSAGSARPAPRSPRPASSSPRRPAAAVAPRPSPSR